MKRILSLMLALLFLIPSSGLAFKGMNMVPPNENRRIAFKSEYPDNPLIEGESSTTGMPFTGQYVPVTLSIDNALGARPNWNTSEADILYLLPNVGGGTTRVVALYADHMPTEAGGSRSFRPIFDQVCQQWGAAICYAAGSQEALEFLKSSPTFKNGLAYDINNDTNFTKRVNARPKPHNLMVNIEKVKQDILAKGKTFIPKPFKFTDALPTNGIDVKNIEVYQHAILLGSGVLGDDDSFFAFEYDANENKYRTLAVNGTGSRSDGYSTKPYIDAKHEDLGSLPFSNVIVMKVNYDWRGHYFYMSNPVGTGNADIFTGGKYIAGGWSRAAMDQRTVFVDQNGEEIALQRGKTFIIVIAENTGDVYYK